MLQGKIGFSGPLTAELLHEHDKECTLRRATVSAYKEELFPWVASFALGRFDFEQLVCVVHVARGLYFVLA